MTDEAPKPNHPRSLLELNACAGVSDETLLELSIRGGLSTLLIAVKLLLEDWDRGRNEPKEVWRDASKNVPEGYWVPISSTVQAENIARLRALLPKEKSNED